MTRVKKFLETENIFAVILLIAGILLPTMTSKYGLSQYSYYLTSVILGLSVTLIWGYAGIFSFSQAVFFGVGGYVYGILIQNIGNAQLSLPVAVIAVLAAGAAACILGYFMFYGGINDVFVGLITLCITYVCYSFMMQTAGGDWTIGDVELGGFNGLTRIPMLSIFGHTFDKIEFYYFVFAVVIIIYIIIRVLQKTKSGYALFAVRENRNRSELFGYNTPFIQTVVFTAGGLIAGLGGVLYSMWGSLITPNNISMTASTLPVVMVAAAGRKSPLACIIFTLAYSIISNKLSASSNMFSMVILGAILIFVILVVPDGILYSVFKKIDKKVFKKDV